jgi:hypothetical protein
MMHRPGLSQEWGHWEIDSLVGINVPAWLVHFQKQVDIYFMQHLIYIDWAKLIRFFVRNFTLLSFGEEAEDDEEEVQTLTKVNDNDSH